MRPKISMQIPPLTGAANVTICHLSGSGKRKQSLGDRDISGHIYKYVMPHIILLQNICVLSEFETHTKSIFSKFFRQYPLCSKNFVFHQAVYWISEWKKKETLSNLQIECDKRVMAVLHQEKYPRRPRSRCSRHTLSLQQRSSHIHFASERTPSAWRLHTAYVLFNSMTSRATTSVVAEGEV